MKRMLCRPVPVYVILQSILILVVGCQKKDAPSPEDDEFKKPETVSIIGGQPVSIETRPYQVLFSIDRGGDSISRGGGSILSPTIIVTAAHLFDKAQLPYTGEVRAGATSVEILNFNGQLRNIDTVIVHPLWNGDVRDFYDIAIVRLSVPLVLDNNCSPINCVAANQLSYQDVGETVTASGWGRTGSVGTGNWHQLLWVHMKVIGKNSLLIPEPFMPRSDKLIYTHRNGTSHEAIGEGDSGGPLTASIPGLGDVLIGISSFAGPDGSDVPSAFTKVSDYLSWISATRQILEPSISGPSSFCSSANYTVSNLPVGATVSWALSDPSLGSLSSSGSASTVTRIGYGSADLIANVSLNGVNYPVSLSIDLGHPTPDVLTNVNGNATLGGCYQFSYRQHRAGTTYKWILTKIPGGSPQTVSTTSALEQCFTTLGRYNLALQITNECVVNKTIYTRSINVLDDDGPIH